MPEDPIGRALFDAADALAAGPLRGQAEVPWRDRATTAGRALARVGLEGVGWRVGAAATGEVETWVEAAMWVVVAVEGAS